MRKIGGEGLKCSNIINDLNNGSDIKKLGDKELDLLAEQLRDEILRVIGKNGGHLASNLGIVETTIALYRNFDFPKDKIVFDVGHQCYAHKILSDRKTKFDSIRLWDGLSGFPDRSESEYDSFTVGHAGTSLSQAIGLATARDHLNEDYTVVCVVGDGAISNGLNLEALTATKKKPKKLIVILNDNGMSISKNKNGFYQFISKGTTKRTYLKSKHAIKKVFRNTFITRWLTRFKDFVKRVINKDNYFEQHGFKYVGVIDGNDIKQLNKILGRVKNIAKEKAVFLHLKTTKGKGYKEAEERADLYHGVGENLAVESGNFSDTLGIKLNQLIDKDNRIVAITAGMKDGTGLGLVENVHPDNFFDVGIAEEYAVTFASGLCAGGLKPVVALYSTFAQRSYDQILHDVCLQNLPVVFCLDRAGLVGKDGKTHQGLYDLSFLSHLPNLEIFTPNTTTELEQMLEIALTRNNPVVIRYPKNHDSSLTTPSVHDGFWKTVKTDVNVKATILAVGPRMLQLALSVSDKISGVEIITVRSVKPIDKDILFRIRNTHVITLEENSVIGGFGSLVCEYYCSIDENTKVTNLGVDDEFISHGSVKEQLEAVGLSVQNVIDKIESRS